MLSIFLSLSGVPFVKSETKQKRAARCTKKAAANNIFFSRSESLQFFFFATHKDIRYKLVFIVVLQPIILKNTNRDKRLSVCGSVG